MSDLFLIAHKVRGKPAFDIAIRCDDMGTESDPGPWWIIPTFGHRAYPYWSVKLDEWDVWEIWQKQLPEMPPSCPDFYAVSDARDAARIAAWEDRQVDKDGSGAALLRSLGLGGASGPKMRRV